MRLQLLALLTVIALPHAAEAQSWREVRNGATCAPYPLTGSNSAGFAYNHFLYGFRGQAFCQLEIPDDWTVPDLSYVLMAGSSPNTGVQGRLCIHDGALNGTCGQSATLFANVAGISFLFPPSDPPPFPVGAYIRLDFPSDSVSTVRYLIPHFSR